jgi:outer membrane protein W
MSSKKWSSLWISATTLLVGSLSVFAGEPRHHERGDQDYGFRARLGIVEPEGNSGFWDDTFDGFTGEVGGFEDPVIGGEFSYALNSHTELWAGVSAFSGSQLSNYEEFVDDAGGEIRHRKTLEVVPLTVGVTFFPIGRNRTIRPYIGAGGGFYAWHYRESGDFIDFGADPPEIVDAEYESDGVTVGYYLTAGVEARLSRHAGIFAEGRWNYAEDEPEDGDFENFGEIDVRNRELTLGLAWRF